MESFRNIRRGKPMLFFKCMHSEILLSIRKHVLIKFFIFIVFAVLCTPVGAQEKIDAIPQKIFVANTPRMVDAALSATFVRTHYVPQKLDKFLENPHPPYEIKRTTISEILVNNNCVRESICDSRQTKGTVKQYAFHYSNDGSVTRNYDARNRMGRQKLASKASRDFLSTILNPHSVFNSGRFISRATGVLHQRFKNAIVEKTSADSNSERGYVSIEGSYSHSDPARSFKAIVNPEMNYALIELTEFNAEGKVLSEMTAAGHRNVSGLKQKLWLPAQVTVKRYRYDDYEGNTVYVAKLDILDPKIINVKAKDFRIVFPADAKRIYDATLDLDLVRAEKEAIPLNISIDEILDTPISKSSTDSSGQDIVSRARKSYQEDNLQLKKTEPALAASRTLALPEKQTRFPVIRAIFVLIAVSMTWFFIRRARIKKRTALKLNAVEKEVVEI